MGGGGGGGDENAPFLLHLRMEELVDKLRLLDYDGTFCPKYKLKPLSSLYFALPGAAAEQLHYLACLVGWLSSLSGATNFTPPELFDDPTAIVANIMHELRQVRALKVVVGVSINYLLTFIFLAPTKKQNEKKARGADRL